MIDHGVLTLPSQPALSDPAGTMPLVNAARWVEQVLLGTTATIIAVLAIATIGFLALSGRIELRRGATTIVGCFILFGAPGIASAFMQMFAGSQEIITATPSLAAPTLAAPPPPPPAVYDPYAGASVERR